MQRQPVPGHRWGARWCAPLRHRWTRLPQSTQTVLIFAGLATFLPVRVRAEKSPPKRPGTPGPPPSRDACCRHAESARSRADAARCCGRLFERGTSSAMSNSLSPMEHRLEGEASGHNVVGRLSSPPHHGCSSPSWATRPNWPPCLLAAESRPAPAGFAGLPRLGSAPAWVGVAVGALGWPPCCAQRPWAGFSDLADGVPRPGWAPRPASDCSPVSETLLRCNFRSWLHLSAVFLAEVGDKTS